MPREKGWVAAPEDGLVVLKKGDGEDVGDEGVAVGEVRDGGGEWGWGLTCWLREAET